VVEGNSGITEALFTLSLSSASCHTVTVEVLTYDGTATAGSDYLPVHTNVVFLPGQTRQTLSVGVIGDTEVEPDETYWVCLTNVTHANVVRSCGLGTIINDDTNQAPSVTLAVVAPCLTLPTNLTLSAIATDPDWWSFRQRNLLGVNLMMPFEFLWQNACGSHLRRPWRWTIRAPASAGGIVRFSAELTQSTIASSKAIPNHGGIVHIESFVRELSQVAVEC
jgi:hypothetical protein